MPRKLIILAAVLFFALPHARADEASKRAKVEEMFTILKMESMMKQMMSQGVAQGQQTAKSIFGDHPMTDADKKIVDAYIARLVGVMTETLSWQKLQPAYVELYSSAYSEEEIDGILAFYKSPVGQTLLSKTPELVAKSGEIVNARAKEMGPQMQEVTAAMIKEMSAAHPDKTPGEIIRVGPLESPAPAAQPVPKKPETP